MILPPGAILPPTKPRARLRQDGRGSRHAKDRSRRVPENDTRGRSADAQPAHGVRPERGALASDARSLAPRQSPSLSCLAAAAAWASAGSLVSFGSAQPWRTIQVERSAPATEQRATTSFCALCFGSSQVTARERINRVRADLAAAPQGHDLPFALFAGRVGVARGDAGKPDDDTARIAACRRRAR